MIDLSTDGCRLLSDHSAPFGGKLTVYFPPELDDGKPFSVRGRVMRSETGEEEQAEVEIISVRFDESSATVVVLVRSLRLDLFDTIARQPNIPLDPCWC